MCKGLSFFIFVVGLVLAGTVYAQDPSLVGWWRLDDGSGGVAVDSSGNGNDGTVRGNPQWTEGIMKGALEFDGSGDYVDCGDDSIFQIQDEITLACWVRIERFTTDWSAIISKGDNSYRLSRSATTGSAIHMGVNGTATQGDAWFDGTVRVTDGQWHHVAGVYNGAMAMIYIDGVLDVDYEATGQINASTYSLYIGENAQATGRYLNGAVDDVRIYNRALSVEEILDVMEGESELGTKPNPENEATDVPRDVVLSWEPGICAETHDIYFGTVFDNVNDADRADQRGVLAIQSHDANAYDPDGLLEFGRTYYWRVDEVNAPPESTIFKGDVWSFTAEPFAYPVENIIATASSNERLQGPENTINGSGLDESGLLHGNLGVDNMWLSNTAGDQPTWIHYEFDRVYKLYEMLVWNSNESLEPVIGLGFKDVIIEYSVDGVEYVTLGTTHEFARAPGTPNYAHNTTVEFNGLEVKYVRLTANSNWGGILNQYGLSEVRFLYVPVKAREPNPAAGATDVPLDVTLAWRQGREADSHNIYFSDDMQAVADGTAAVVTTGTASHGPLNLDLGTTYYWRVDEVNEAQSPDAWQGDVWDFTTQEYFVVDDFESYNDFEPDTIYLAWIDGYNDTANGSTSGYPDPAFGSGEHYVEVDIVHGDRQSMPLFYDNTAASFSEVTVNTNDLEIGRDWSRGSPESLVLWFYGDPNNAVTEQLYVKVDDVKAIYDGDANNIAVQQWNQWNVNLLSLGIDISNITTLSIGLERTGAAGGSGLVLIDDIRLYRRPPVE